VSILNTVDDRDAIGFSDLSYLTTRFREIAINTLPKQRYAVMSIQSIVAFLGSEEQAIFYHQYSYNKELRETLNISYSIDPLIVPRDGIPAVGLAFNVRY